MTQLQNMIIMLLNKLLVLHILLKQTSRDVSHELNNMAKFLIRLIENGGEIFE